ARLDVARRDQRQRGFVNAGVVADDQQRVDLRRGLAQQSQDRLRLRRVEPCVEIDRWPLGRPAGFLTRRLPGGCARRRRRRAGGGGGGGEGAGHEVPGLARAFGGRAQDAVGNQPVVRQVGANQGRLVPAAPVERPIVVGHSSWPV